MYSVSAPAITCIGTDLDHIGENTDSIALQASIYLHVPKAEMAEKVSFLRTLNVVCKA